MNHKLLLYASFVLCTMYACGSKKQNDLSFGGNKSDYKYDLTKPSTAWNLPDSLKEVSGVDMVDENHFLLIEDLHPLLYLVRLQKEVVIEKEIPFAEQAKEKFDVEDLATNGDTAYALWSHGVVYKISYWKSKPDVTEWETGLTKKNNTEGLCFDPVSRQLLIACKNKSGEDDEKKSTRAVYMFDLVAGRLREEPFLLIHKKDFKNEQDESFDFYPSALAVHPLTHDLYILSTKDTKALAIYSYEGKLKSFQSIDKELMPQPEGICFSPKGYLYIATEGRHGQPAKILEFHPKENLAN